MATSEKDDDRDEKDAGEQEGSDEGEEREAAPAKEEAPKPARSAKKSAADARRRGPGARARSATPPKGGSLGKSVVLFIVIVGGLLLGFAFLAREQPAEAVRPRWTAGQTVDLEITLVKSDRQELACFSADEMNGKHCAFEANNKPWSKGDNNDDKKLYKPYTTTDRVQFLAAGLWADPGMSPDKIPASRFSVKCKYKIDGVMKSLGVRWESNGQWYPNNDWYAGSVSDCKIGP